MQKKPFSTKRTVLGILCGILGAAAALLLGVTLLFHGMLSRIHYVSSQESPALFQESPAPLTQTDPFPETGPLPSQSAVPTAFLAPAQSQAKPVNILLVGQDRREGESRSRSDSMILCTMNPETNQITMTSILRDLYVNIPGFRPDRINAAYAAGGIPLLTRTLEENFEIAIDGTVEVDFSQFSQIIDLAGGITVDLRQDEADAINEAVPGELEAGQQQLSGSQALAYARIRNLDADGDFSRTNRQRNVITSLLEQYRNASLTTLLATAMEILPMISTDMTQGQLLRYAMELFPLLSDAQLVSQRIPADGTYTNQTIRQMAVLVADMDAARQLLRDTAL